MQPAILFLIDALERPGGTETHLYELSRRLAPAGYHPIVCNLSGDEPMLARIAEAGIETWPERIGRLYTPLGRSIERRIVHRALNRDIRAVHTFHFKSDWMGVSTARSLRCPLISSRRDLGFQQNLPRRMIYRWVNRRSDAMIVPSSAVRDSVLRQGGASPEQIHLIYNGLEVERFALPVDRAAMRRRLDVPADALLVGMVGNLRPVKDHPTLLRAIARLVPVVSKVHLVLIGEGAEEPRLRALAAELGIETRVSFAGPTSEIPHALGAMDVFVLSSRSEGMSNAILEAMAAGLPVVATDVGGNPECVVDGETGYIVPRANDERMAERLATLLGRPEAAARMGAAARLRVRELFDVDGMVRRTVDLYDALGCRGEKGAIRANA